MKFFSRKALVAGATAIAVSFAGVNVASAEPATAPAMSSGSSAGDFLKTLGGSSNNTPNNTKDTPAHNTGTTTENTSSSPKDIKEWIGIITAVVGALSAIYTFINKISK
ncbi:hypothetical protein [Corynebacterium flavescens]|uniref:hypothetical protein n=1 Tax=Corynebacterium flavescens TaxID=28028 RepID=UPI0026481004|nr:hypothetical protein [Corynebacterium flavescens]MDN6431055.1 hypothetical protein [Corynebacterium flavescens]MDN6474718.1 hypothetical protein [Corynebacterium flavescens]MDN6823439.1 hypothetical protein [Corynebacterium flavescens]